MSEKKETGSAKLQSFEVEHVKMLKRRQDFLQERMDRTRKPLRWDEREYRAITWALNRVQGVA